MRGVAFASTDLQSRDEMMALPAAQYESLSRTITDDLEKASEVLPLCFRMRFYYLATGQPFAG